MIDISVIILTFNSEKNLETTLRSALKVSDDIHIVDSFSKDRTLEIADHFGVSVSQRKFINYSDQRNWAMDNLMIAHPWQLHLDSDEILSDELIEQIEAIEPDEETNGYFIPRLTIFLNRPIYHGGMYPIWHMRLFRAGTGRCENRQYDQHFHVIGKTGKLTAPMIDDQRLSLSDWTLRHNHWSDLETKEVVQHSSVKNVIAGDCFGNPVEKKRYLKEWYYRAPKLYRAFFLFIYRYIFRLGFLDGKEGLIFFVLQTFWFRFLIDAKIIENENQG